MKVFVDKRDAEKCLTYTRKYLTTSESAYLDARHAAVEYVVNSSDISSSTKMIVRDTIKEMAWITARNNKTNEAFWIALKQFDIYPSEERKNDDTI